jgi:hypothetical protein
MSNNSGDAAASGLRARYTRSPIPSDGETKTEIGQMRRRKGGGGKAEHDSCVTSSAIWTISSLSPCQLSMQDIAVRSRCPKPPPSACCLRMYRAGEVICRQQQARSISCLLWYIRRHGTRPFGRRENLANSNSDHQNEDDSDNAIVL